MKRAWLMGAAAAVLMTVNGAAQNRQNFAGTWTIDTAKTQAEGGAAAGGMRGAGGGGRGGGVATATAGGAATTGGVATTGAPPAGAVARGGRGGGGGGSAAPTGTVLAIDANTFSVTQGTTTTAYKTDGSVTNLDNDVRKASAKAAWQGEKLVIETTTQTQNGPVVTTATWYLEGEWLVRENKSTGPDGQPVIRKTFFKKGTSH